MLIRRKYHFVLVMYFFIALIASAHTLAQTFNYKIFTPADGLPDASVNFIFEDSHGYLWISSCGGLTRYDGKNFMSYGLEDGLNSLCNIISMEDNEHNLWGISSSAYTPLVIKFSNGRFSTFPFNVADSITYIFNILQTKDNKIWAATTEGVFELNNTKWKKVALIPNSSHKTIRHVVTLDDGSLLINNYDQILLRKKDGTVQIVADTSQCKWYNSIVQYKQGILITGYNRLFMYDKKGLHAIHDDVIKGQFICSSIIDSKGRIWIAGYNDGIMRFDANKVLRFGFKDGLPHPLNVGLCEDREGNIWLGNFKGLIRLRESYIQKFGKENGLTQNDVRIIFMDRSGRVFFGHPDEGFSYWGNERMTANTSLINKKDQSKFISILTGFAEDEKGRLWIALNSGNLLRYQNGKLDDLTKLIRSKEKFLERAAFNTHDSCVYIESDSIIFRIKDDSLKEIIPVVIDKQTARLSLIYLDKNNNLWISTRSGKLGIYDHKKNIFYNSSVDFTGAQIHNMLQDNNGNIWVATLGKGIKEFNVDKENHITQIFSVTKIEGLADNVVVSIALDSAGYLWAECTNGVTRFNLHQKNKDGHLLYQNFGIEDGLTTKSFNDGSLLVDRKNNVWLGTPDGLFRFDSKKIYADTLSPQIQIEKVVLINDSSNWKNYATSFSNYFHLPVNPSLPFNKNNLTIYYNGIAFVNNKDIEYAYKLDGLDTSWNNPSLNTYASYINLSAGDYIFHVKARRKNYAWSEEATFSFTITPPFWETWWFRTITIAAASSLLIFAFRIRVKQIRRKASIQQQMQELEMKALKAQMNPHFIYNAMNSIQALVMNDQPEQAVRYIGKFAKLLRQVLNNSDKSLVSLDSELSSLKLYIELESLRLHINFDYCIEVDEIIVQENEMVPPLVLQPYVENALWHGLSNKEGERKLHITINTDDEFLICEIRDNGIGRTKAGEIKSKNTTPNTSKGLDITRRRLSLMNDESSSPVTIEDLYENGNPSGTKVVLKIKRHFVV